MGSPIPALAWAKLSLPTNGSFTTASTHTSASAQAPWLQVCVAEPVWAQSLHRRVADWEEG